MPDGVEPILQAIPLIFATGVVAHVGTEVIKGVEKKKKGKNVFDEFAKAEKKAKRVV